MNPYAMHQVGKARQRDLLEAARPGYVDDEEAARTWREKLTLTVSSLAVIAALIILIV